MAPKPKCPSCGGTQVTTIRFQGETYYQCVTPKPRGKGGELAPCKYWSTKWRPTATGGNGGD